VATKVSEKRADKAPQPLADAALVRRALAGDLTAFDALVLRYQRQANVAAWRLLGSRDDAAEVVQDALLKAFESLASLDKPERFGPWLMRIVCNLSLNRRRGRALRKAMSLSGGDDDEHSAGASLADRRTDDPQERASGRELEELIQQAIDNLPELQRQALVLFSISGMAQKDVAEVLHTSVEAVKWHVFTARKKLREQLDEYL
jgi:RNA polymerase sigma-70 factor (ECF subfamily)